MCSRVVGSLNENIVEVEAATAVASLKNLQASEIRVALKQFLYPSVLVRGLNTQSSAGNQNYRQNQWDKPFAVEKEKIARADHQEQKRGAIHGDGVGHQGNHDIAN